MENKVNKNKKSYDIGRCLKAISHLQEHLSCTLIRENAWGHTSEDKYGILHELQRLILEIQKLTGFSIEDIFEFDKRLIEDAERRFNHGKKLE